MSSGPHGPPGPRLSGLLPFLVRCGVSVCTGLTGWMSFFPPLGAEKRGEVGGDGGAHWRTEEFLPNIHVTQNHYSLTQRIWAAEREDAEIKLPDCFY